MSKFGLMQDRQLMISSFLRYAAEYHGDQEIVTRSLEGPIHRYTYRDAELRARKLGQALQRLKVSQGDTVASLAWNTFRHFELFYGVSGIGAVLHTVNPRLFEEQVRYIINHAEDRFLFVEPPFVPLIEELWDQLKTVEAVVVLADRGNMPDTALPNVLCYEDLLDAESGDMEWPEFDERSALSLCYTSGTTGNPKGVLYSHRSTAIHMMAVAQPGFFGISPDDVVMPVVPMYHASAWGLPYMVAMVGAKLVLPGSRLDAQALHELITDEKVTWSGAVPTVWTSLFQYLEETGGTLDSLTRTVIGGSSVPKTMIDKFREDYGVQVLHAWGMTEMNPIGTVSTPTAQVNALPENERLAVLEKPGRVIYSLDMKIVDASGSKMPHDGVSSGAIWVRGPSIAAGYFKGEGGELLDDEGYFPTGDVGTLDEYGYLKITDRTKDVIKSGGEWISSIDLENLATGHADVREAAVVGVYHPRWEERPLLIIVKRPGSNPESREILDYLRGKIADWWLPDDVIFIEKLPLTATGKIDKKVLREMYRDHLVEKA